MKFSGIRVVRRRSWFKDCSIKARAAMLAGGALPPGNKAYQPSKGIAKSSPEHRPLVRG